MSRSSWRPIVRTLLAAALIVPAVAEAQATGTVADTFDNTSRIDPANSTGYALSGGKLVMSSDLDVGTGGDGVCTVSSTVNINTGSCTGRIIADAPRFTLSGTVGFGANSLNLTTSAAGALFPDDEVLILAVQGTGAGTFETRQVRSVSGTSVLLTAGVTRAYSASKVIVQRVPNYSRITVNPGGVLQAGAWGGSTGGVFFVRSQGAVVVNGSIDMSGRGFRGALSLSSWGGGYRGEGWDAIPSPWPRTYVAGGGAGGGGDAEDCHSGQGGSGGGYGTAGAQGLAAWLTCGTTWYYGRQYSQPGAPYGTANLATLFFGGGGGGGGVDGDNPDWGGEGGDGGGIIAIHADSISVTGSIRSNGGNGSYGIGETGGGAGGAGGSILLRAHTVALGANLVTASGGAAGGAAQMANNGGAGGVGRIAVYAASVTGSSSPASTNTLPIYSNNLSVVSTNLLASAGGPSQPRSLVYNLASLPSGTTARVQFSPDGTNWYSAVNQLNGSTTLSPGANQTLDLSSLRSWWGTTFRVRLLLTGTSATPALDDYTFTYATDSTAPTVPGTPSVARNLQTNSFSLGWTASTDSGGSGFARYELQVSSDGGANWTTLATPTDNSATFDGSAASAGNYVFRVRALDVAGNASAFSGTSTPALVDRVAPSVPGTPSLSSNPANGTVTVSWTASSDASTGVAGYQVELSVNDGASWGLIASPTGTTYTLGAAQGRYLLRVRAMDIAGNLSGYSANSAPLVVDLTAPSVPGIPSATPNPTAGQVNLSWAASSETGGSGLDRYEVQVSTDGGTSWLLLTQGLNASYGYSAVGGSFRYRVRAVDAAGNASAYSAPSDVVLVDRTAPPPPASVTASPDFARTSATVFWAASADSGSGTASYRVASYRNGSGSPEAQTTVTTTSVTFSGLTSGRYLFTVVAIDRVGNESQPAASNEIVADTSAPPQPGTPVAAVNPSAGPVDLSWAAVNDVGLSGLARYELLVSADDGATWSLLALLSSNSYAGAALQGSYRYKVRAIDRSGNASPDSGVSAQLLVDTSAPLPPGQPRFSSSISSGDVGLSWQPAVDLGGSGVESYEVEVSVNNGNTFTQVADRVSSPTTLSLGPGEYLARVRARDVAGNLSEWSVLSNPVTIDQTAPSAPATISATPNPANGDVVLTWAEATDSGGAGLSGYYLEYSMNDAWRFLTSVPGTSFTLALPDGSYGVRVRATDAAGNMSLPTELSSPLVFDRVAPLVPGAPAVTPNPSGGEVSISWPASTDRGLAGLARYELQVSADLGASWALLVSPTSPAHRYDPAQGRYLYRVRAVDNATNRSAFSPPSAAVVVDKTPPPAPSYISASPSPSDGAPITLRWGDSTDSGGTNVNGYKLFRSDNGGAFNLVTTVSALEATQNLPSGLYVFGVAAVDVVGNTSTMARTQPVRVTRVPVASPASLATDEDTTLEITLQGADDENDPLTFTVLFQPQHGTLRGTPPNLEYTPSQDYNGSDSFTFRVNDGTWDSQPATVGITVRPVNDAPIAGLVEVVADEDTGAMAVLTGTDVDRDRLTYEIVEQPQHGRLIGDLPNLTYAPDQDFNGSDFFTFRVFDGKLYSEPRRVPITVLPVNDRPLAQAQAVAVDEGSAVEITLVGSDVDGDTLTYRVSTPPGHGTLTGTAPSLRYTPTVGFKGTDTFQFVSRDAELDSLPATVTITVRNVAPTVTLSVSKAAYDEGEVVTFFAAASDPGRDTLSYAWDFGDGASSTEARPTHAYENDGTYTATMTVSDGAGGSAQATVQVVVSNVAPTLTISASPVSSFEGAAVQLTASATDPGTKDVLSYSWEFGDGAISAEQNPTHVWRDQGTFTVIARVDDGDGGYDVQTLTVTVANVAPRGSIEVDDADLFEGMERTLTALASDPGDDVLSFAWDFGDGQTSTEQAPTHSWVDDGTYEVVLVISDGEGGVTAVRREIVVGNAAPSITSLTLPPSAKEGSEAAFEASATDPGVDDVLTYLWSWGDSSPVTEGDKATHTWAESGSYQVTLEVRDDGGAKTTRTITVDVENVAPVPVNPGVQTVEAGELLSLVLTATDAGGAHDPLTWSLVSGPGTITDAGRWSWRPPPELDETLQVVARVQDDDGASSEVAFNVVVQPRDGDDDGVLDRDDNCKAVANPNQEDTDGNGIGDACDGDLDGDGKSNAEDNCVDVANADQADLDHDGKGDLCDEDIDGDGIPNDRETELGLDPRKRDTDGDTISDTDEIGDAAHPRDTDGDGIIDALDTDSDGDGISDADEAGDTDLDTPPVDTDKDGTPDVRDTDSDGDGVEDGKDVCRLVQDADQLDTDADGIGDACDGDLDGDGVANETDVCPGIANADQADLDADGKGDLCDGDLDGDGTLNEQDNCPQLANADQSDVDSDGKGDACDDTDGRPVAAPSGCGCGPTDGTSSLALGLVLGALILRRRRSVSAR